MVFVLPQEKKNDFFKTLRSGIKKVPKPSEFNPISMLLRRTIDSKGIYGNTSECSFWVRAYNAKGYENTIPGRHCHGKVVDNGDEVVIKITWRIAPYWSVSLAIIYLFLTFDVAQWSDRIGIFFVFLVGYFAAVILGIILHRNEERQVIEFLKSIYDSLLKEQKDG